MNYLVEYAILSIFLLMAVAFFICFFVIGIQRLIKEFRTMKKGHIILHGLSLIVNALMIAAIIFAGMIFTIPYVDL